MQKRNKLQRQSGVNSDMNYIFSMPGYESLARQLARTKKLSIGHYSSQKFLNQEIHLELQEKIAV